ncbi:hypothetical protein GCM10023185_29830 [Hymenobacter saemangeumensis]|uniref:Uncharacterized protein n=1 Tax=Hymenobacter saemangeumensis TaxID=1084522 RepID=A0ABP8IL70_9BACT
MCNNLTKSLQSDRISYLLPGIGDQMELNSGSPPLTVVAVHAPLPNDPPGQAPTVDLFYFHEHQVMQIQQLDIRCLRPLSQH